MKILVKVEILVSFMTSLVAGRVATVMDPMFTAKMIEVSNFKIAQFVLLSFYCTLKPVTN